jgi:hypothetical protein
MAFIAAHSWDEAQTKQFCYVVLATSDNGFGVRSNASQIGESWVKLGSSWQCAPVFFQASGDVAAVGDGGVAAYAWPAGQSKQVCYFADDGSIRELKLTTVGALTNAAWSSTTITASAKAPHANAFRELSGYAWNKGGTKQVVYAGDDAHVHELCSSDGVTWKHTDLTQESTTPPFSAFDGGQIVGYSGASFAWKQVVYADTLGNIIELYFGQGGSWKFANLTEATGAPPSSRDFLSAYVWDADGSKHVFYTSTDGHIHELRTKAGNWIHRDLMLDVPSAAHPQRGLAAYGWPAGGSQQVAYVDGDGEVNEFYRPGNALLWRHANLTQDIGSPIMTAGHFAAYSWDPAKSKQVLYATSDGKFHELYYILGASKWKHATVPGTLPT